jgi:hypothetical protein
MERLTPAPPRRRWNDHDWVILFERLEAEGYWAGESDYPVAINLYKSQVEAGDSRPQGTYAWEWLCEMYERVRDGVPGVTEAEYNELKDWYMRNESVVHDGDVRYAFINTYRRGPRRFGATATVERLRALRAAHPGLE